MHPWLGTVFPWSGKGTTEEALVETALTRGQGTPEAIRGPQACRTPGSAALCSSCRAGPREQWASHRGPLALGVGAHLTDGDGQGWGRGEHKGLSLEGAQLSGGAARPGSQPLLRPARGLSFPVCGFGDSCALRGLSGALASALV